MDPNRRSRVAQNDDRTARLSVIDRLIDFEPRVAADPSISLNESVRRYKESVLRDLEWLLNTRRTILTVPEECAEVARSTFVYGLPDISSMSGDSEPTRRQLLRDVEECIRIFEPRLSGVRVSPVEEQEGAQRRVRFIIEGLLKMEPNPERVLFDTMLDLSSGRIQVAGGG
jgi:type VI secretion system protein ImpF